MVFISINCSFIRADILSKMIRLVSQGSVVHPYYKYL